MYPPLVRSIEVPCDQEEAFTVFLERMGSWWPLARFSASVKFGGEPDRLLVEPKAGGEIVEVDADGGRHLWGTIKRYEPYEYVSMDFHIGLSAETASLVEVSFTPIAEGRTRVMLTQSEWERFGRYAENMLNGYPKGWTVIFEQAYLAACGRANPATAPAGELTEW